MKYEIVVGASKAFIVEGKSKKEIDEQVRQHMKNYEYLLNLYAPTRGARLTILKQGEFQEGQKAKVQNEKK